MFKRHKRQSLCKIVIRDHFGRTILESDESCYELPEPVTVELSTEFFNDPEPCEIHRAAVRHRAVQQLREACPPGTPVNTIQLPENLKKLLPDSAETICFMEDTL